MESPYRNPLKYLYQKILIFTLGDILDILVQCNKSKPTPTSTSSLGFNRLYILILGFIVIQILYYTLIQ